MSKGKDPDPYLWLMDTDPEGPKTSGSGSGSPTLGRPSLKSTVTRQTAARWVVLTYAGVPTAEKGRLRIRIPTPWLMDPDPGVPKTSGSRTLGRTTLKLTAVRWVVLTYAGVPTAGCPSAGGGLGGGCDSLPSLPGAWPPGGYRRKFRNSWREPGGRHAQPRYSAGR